MVSAWTELDLKPEVADFDSCEAVFRWSTGYEVVLNML